MEVRSLLPSKKQRAWLAEEVPRLHNVLLSDDGEAGREFLTARGIPEEVWVKWKLGYQTDGSYRGRISIPYWTPSGYTSMVFRCIHLPGMPCKELDHHEKYMALPGYRPMFNVRALSIGADRVFVSEGEVNAFLATYDGFPTVATGSNSGWRPWWSYMFDGPSEVVALVDGDEAGQALAHSVRRNLFHGRAIAFPDGYDYASYRQEYGSDAVKAYVLDRV